MSGFACIQAFFNFWAIYTKPPSEKVYLVREGEGFTHARYPGARRFVTEGVIEIADDASRFHQSRLSRLRQYCAPALYRVGRRFGLVTPSVATNPHLKRPSFIDRAFSRENRQTAKRFVSAYAETWVGMSPLWLMGEAITPGKKVGTRFMKGKSKLFESAEEVRTVLSTSGKDIVVIVDEKIRESRGETAKAAEVLKAAGWVVYSLTLDDVLMCVLVERTRYSLRP